MESKTIDSKTRKLSSQFVNVGEFKFSESPVQFRTLLGSCVSVCLYDPFNQFGGMNHILLPGRAEKEGGILSARFGINAMELLINEFVKRGTPRSRLQAKIVGGGQTLNLGVQNSPIGDRNVEFVKDFLKSESISLCGLETGGPYYRNLRFMTGTFEAFVKRVQVNLQKSFIERQEVEYLRQVQADLGKKNRPIYF
ncbi:chemotaxis protein CheD [Leptospira wolffii]|uniref:Probable chemoreceptor glutamine deamidase CheD n=1 Tax=Leptospira wolffii TaxID=409998 RepID=A0ABV5BKF5_9LEPT|nr:chemotaxis protein CheD [Leptospira wolffii]EPG64555.1 chemotactic sensory transduction protein CheD [Leptospira wolffii serovar Khorat str. Khorat-H2]TGL49385.1 chemotaxis protein CheD [Leptospira wolffii]